MHQPGAPEKREQVFVAHDVGDAGVDAPFHPVRQAARDQLLAELNELAAVDGGFFIGEDEKANLMVIDQAFNLVGHLFRVAHAVIAPEFPLATEGTGKGAPPRHVGNGDPHAKRGVKVL